jgi:hypothetical protein
MKPKLTSLILALFLFIPYIFQPSSALAQLSLIRPIIFPVIGHASFGNDFGDPRSGGRIHEGNDIFGKKMQPLVAAVDGTIGFTAWPEASWGYSVSIRDSEGYRYSYLHINNDTPGTDDGKGGGMFAYAPDIASGNPVVKGQLIGWMGDSGNAETTPPHLHFEIRAPNGDVMNPYESLKAAERIAAPVGTYPALPQELLPYANFTGGMNVAAGNLDSGTEEEVVTGAGAGGGPLVRTYTVSGLPQQSFYAYAESFRGGVDVAVGDIDGDGKAEIITAPGSGGGPHIRIFKADGNIVNEFFAYDSRFRGGVYISAADLDNDGKAEIITGPGATGGPHIKVFSGTGKVIKEFLAYTSNFKGGVDVAAAKQGSSGVIVTAPGAGGGPHIKVFDNTGSLTNEFFAYDGSFNLGVRVTAGNLDSDSAAPEIATLPATGGGPHLKVFQLDGTLGFSNFAAFEPWWRSGYDLAATKDSVYIGSGPGRRASLRIQKLSN